MKTVLKRQLLSLMDGAETNLVDYKSSFKLRLASDTLTPIKNELADGSINQIITLKKELNAVSEDPVTGITESQAKDYINKLNTILLEIQIANTTEEGKKLKYHRSFKQNRDAKQGYFEAWYNKTWYSSHLNTAIEKSMAAVDQFMHKVELIPPTGFFSGLFAKKQVVDKKSESNLKVGETSAPSSFVKPENSTTPSVTDGTTSNVYPKM